MTELTTNKQDKEREALMQAVAARSSKKPPSSDLSSILGPDADDPAPVAKAAAKAPKVVKVTGGGLAVDTSEVAHLVLGRRHLERATKTPAPASAPEAPAPELPAAVVVPAPAEAVVVAAPWADAHPRVKEKYLFIMPEELHMKLAWLADNVARTSMAKVILAGVEKEVAALLEQHYTPTLDQK